jgi:hypothetical protein
MIFRSTVKMIAAATVSVGLLLATPGVAIADSSWRWSDGFEGTPSQTWAFDWGGNFQIGAGVARTSSNNAYLPMNNDFVSVRTTLQISDRIFYGTGYNCQATAWVRALTNSNGYSTADVNFEIIDEPSWTYMALKNYKVSTGGWTKITTGYWSSGDKTPALRVSLLRNSAPLRVDDVEATCDSWTLT